LVTQEPEARPALEIRRIKAVGRLNRRQIQRLGKSRAVIIVAHNHAALEQSRSTTNAECDVTSTPRSAFCYYQAS
jgi:hypothetical protein